MLSVWASSGPLVISGFYLFIYNFSYEVLQNYTYTLSRFWETCKDLREKSIKGNTVILLLYVVALIGVVCICCRQFHLSRQNMSKYVCI